ncbi:MAG: nickel pincer cofactor biosynthesis protein LarC [Victivallales bacterium]|jgi:uncharacterized protein (TIGR00299 family) protein|nr:nickel pincer cofactor biosynthesis protein LarC [Victivallales bacterium]
MKIVRFDSVGGGSGDMILGALIGLGASREKIAQELERLLPGHFALEVENCSSYGIAGIRASVILPEADLPKHTHEHHGHHTHHTHHAFREIRTLIENSDLPGEVKRSSIEVFALLAKVEGKIHGKAPEDVTFHEVGAVDSIVDIVGSNLAFYLLGAEAISLSPLPVGCGTVHCAHGIMPIPAPATAELLTCGLEIAPSDEPFELLTPTGAALFASWQKKTIPTGAKVLALSNAFGQRELKNRPNLLRAMLLDTASSEIKDEVVEELSCNIDDCTGEVVGYLSEQLRSAGALDVWIEPIQMKKHRPGVKLCVLTTPEKRGVLAEMIFKESSTLGIRIAAKRRLTLNRSVETIETEYGAIQMKLAYCKNGEILNAKPEYEECSRIAGEKNIPLTTVIQAAKTAFFEQKK